MIPQIIYLRDQLVLDNLLSTIKRILILKDLKVKLQPEEKRKLKNIAKKLST